MCKKIAKLDNYKILSLVFYASQLLLIEQLFLTLHKSIIMLYGCYLVGMLLYICIPLDFVMGRLMNNIHILSSILIPEIYFNNVSGKKSDVSYFKIKRRKNQEMLLMLFLVIIALFILINQLVKQSGYYPYKNIVIDKILSWLL